MPKKNMQQTLGKACSAPRSLEVAVVWRYQRDNTTKCKIHQKCNPMSPSTYAKMNKSTQSYMGQKWVECKKIRGKEMKPSLHKSWTNIGANNDLNDGKTSMQVFREIVDSITKLAQSCSHWLCPRLGKSGAYYLHWKVALLENLQHKILFHYI